MTFAFPCFPSNVHFHELLHTEAELDLLSQACGSPFHREETDQRKIKLSLLHFWHCCGYRITTSTGTAKAAASSMASGGKGFPRGLSLRTPRLLITDYSSTFLDRIFSLTVSVPRAWASLFLIMRSRLSTPGSPAGPGLLGGMGSVLCRLPTCGFVPTAAPAAGCGLRIVPCSQLSPSCCRSSTGSERRGAAEGHGWSLGLRWRARGSGGAGGALRKQRLLSALCLPPSAAVLRAPERSRGDPREVWGQDDSWNNDLAENELCLALLSGGRFCFSGIATARWKGPGMRGKGEMVSCSVMQFPGGGNPVVL